MPDQDNNAKTEYQYLNPPHPGVEKLYKLLMGLESHNFKNRNVEMHPTLKNLSKNENSVLLFHGNHEGHVDYVVQLIELARAGMKLPLVGARDKLHDDLLNDKRLGNRLALPIYEHHTYNIPKGDGKKILTMMIDIEKNLIDKRKSILKYPGGGLSKNGKPREFGRLSYKVPVSYLLSLMEKANENPNVTIPNVYIIPSSISQEIVPDFGYYADEHASKNPDEGRWNEIIKHFIKGKKGDISLSFNKPILVNDYLNLGLPQKEIENILKENSWNSVMSSIPLQSTDIVALSTLYSMFGEDVLLPLTYQGTGKAREVLDLIPKETSGNFQKKKKDVYDSISENSFTTNKEAISNSVEKLLYYSDKIGIKLSPNAKNVSSDELTQKVYRLFSKSDKSPFIEPSENKDFLNKKYNPERGNFYALLMYANRAMAKIEHRVKNNK